MKTPSRRHILTACGAALGTGALAACITEADPSTSPGAAVGGDGPHTSAGVVGSQPLTSAVVADGKQALERLLAGNARFVAAEEQDLDEGIARRIAVSKGQHPFATILGCVDSRVPIELVFDQGLGDLVVVRSAGGALDRSVIGSLEFGVAELHTPLLLVLGHQRCGALDATIKAVDEPTRHPGKLGYLVDTLAPAVRQTSGKPGDRLTNAVHANVTHVLAELRRSPVIAPLEKSGDLQLAGAYYELDTGKVTLEP
ncbi:carbonic anhydrase [Kribbella sp. VKM Ac-2571]|uniref:carbonic anhydrase n=1 Tax=Kribbella sp. VKM Ac-2571 TaxID=2512222 RepID=UPI00105F4E80|nr:carbonic anhydrase [Kribbella sp. VKM Ac-2571]TDO51229.1 carbonic anhydrase [Kribbella sp. VKM Ac-2571]